MRRPVTALQLGVATVLLVIMSLIQDSHISDLESRISRLEQESVCCAPAGDR